MSPTPYLTAKQAARLVGLSPRRFYDRLRGAAPRLQDGSSPWRRVGGRWRIDPEKLRRYMGGDESPAPHR